MSSKMKSIYVNEGIDPWMSYSVSVSPVNAAQNGINNVK